MVVPSIVLTTIVVFIVVEFLLRLLLRRVRARRTRRAREQALAAGLALDVSDEAPTLKRVALDEPRARILAVDDESIILDSFRKVLVLGGYSIDTVETGPEALGLIQGHDYDFVFTDLKMPGMDGVEVTKAVRHLRPDIDVAVITGYATIETAVETVRSGAMDYVQKPFTDDELLQFVDAAVTRRQARLDQQPRHRIRPVRPGTGLSRSRYELNVPAGAFVSPQHAWARIELNGTVRVGLDDLIRKIFGTVDRVELPAHGQKIHQGDPLFAVSYDGYRLRIPSPFSGTVTVVNHEHAEHPEWLVSKPFELSWMCGIEPSNLAGELAGMRIGQDALDWYQSEMDRLGELAERVREEARPEESDGGDAAARAERARNTKILAGFMEPLLQC